MYDNDEFNNESLDNSGVNDVNDELADDICDTDDTYIDDTENTDNVDEEIFISQDQNTINRKKALSKCLCQYGGIIAVTSILTIALVLVILSVTLAATSTLSAVLIGLLFALISAVFLSFLFFIYCIINKKCGCNNSYNNNYCCYSASNTSNVDSCGFDLE